MLPIRIAQFATLFFAIGHTIGMFQSRYRDDAEKAAVEALQAYRFDIMGVQRSHWDFYQGMGFSLSLFLVFCLLLMQWLIPIMQAQPALARPIVYALSAVFLVMAAFCVRWFFPAPLIMSAVAAIALGWAAFKLH